MNKKILALLLASTITTQAQAEDFGDFFDIHDSSAIIEGDSTLHTEGLPEYELSEAEKAAIAEAERLAEAERNKKWKCANLTKKETRFIQDTECAHTYKVRDRGPGGGWVFYVSDGGKHGIEFAPKEIELKEWGCENTRVEGAHELGIGEGWQNTQNIRIAGCSPLIKQLDRQQLNGFADWFIGSRDEVELFLTVFEPEDYAYMGYDNSDTMLWTSTQHNRDLEGWDDEGVNAYVITYTSPSTRYITGKSNANCTIPFRYF